MIVKEFENIIGEEIPLILKEDFDNVGLMIGEENMAINKVMVSLDCTLEVIEEAIENNCNLIFTHHPLIFRKPNVITDRSLLGKKIIKIIKNNIAVYSAHTNLDSVENGINDALVEILGFKNSKILSINKAGKNIGVNAGIGRIVDIEEGIYFTKLLKIIKDKLNLNSIRFSGDENKVIKKIAIINGSGQSFFDQCKTKNVDAIISGDTTYHYVSDFKEEGINIIDIGHFSSEWIAFIKTSENLEKKLVNRGYNIEFVYSKKIKDPYSDWI